MCIRECYHVYLDVQHSVFTTNIVNNLQCNNTAPQKIQCKSEEPIKFKGERKKITRCIKNFEFCKSYVNKNFGGK
jgi:hypothetical protein